MNEWPLKSGRFNNGRGPVVVDRQPTSGEERVTLARRFAHDFGLQLDAQAPYRVLVDNPELGDPFEREYAPWPLRLFLLSGSSVEWIAQPRGCSYDDAVSDLLKILELNK